MKHFFWFLCQSRHRIRNQKPLAQKGIKEMVCEGERELGRDAFSFLFFVSSTS
jgi:hypothetical protein